MIQFTEEEKNEVVEYYLSQSLPDTEVTFAQKVYEESIIGHTHSVWDIHSSDGRWWIITNPTNLYSQDQFPNMDLALTFHMGLCLRIPRNDIKVTDVKNVRPFTQLMQSIADCELALAQANDAGAFRAIGVRCRENLLAFVHAVQDASEWPEEDRPQRSNFNAWVDWIFDTFQGGSENRERRRLIKTSLREAWTYVNWLTHSQSGCWLDAEAATHAVSHALGMAVSICTRRLRKVPDECPECGSHRLFPDEGMNDQKPEIVFERPVCEGCGWTGEPVPVGERSQEQVAQFVTRIGENSDECGIMQTPLTDIKRPYES